VPTPLQRRGDFSETRTSARQLITIYDPLTLQRDAAGRLSRDPFPRNLIPPQRWDSSGAAAVGFYPEPNVAGDPVTNASNYLSTNSGTDAMNNYGARADHNFGETNKLFGRFSFRKDERVDAPLFDNPSGVGGAPTDRAYNVTISDVHVFSPTLTAELKASFARHHTAEISASYGFDLKQLNFPQNFVSVARPFFPKINVADVQSMGRDRYYDQRRDTTAVQGNVTKLAGRHSMKTGFDFRVPRFHLNRNLNSTGASGSVDHTGAFSINRLYYGFYFQEDWTMSPRFTLNMGLRYNLDIGQQVGLPLRGLLRFTGTDGNWRNLLTTDRNNFSPRFGIAWQLFDKTAIRAGEAAYWANKGTTQDAPQRLFRHRAPSGQYAAICAVRHAVLLVTGPACQGLTAFAKLGKTA